MEHVWYKATYSSGHGNPWVYLRIDDKLKGQDLYHHIENVINAPRWSEKYSGTKFKKVKIEDVPREIVDLKIAREKDTIKNELERAKRSIAGAKIRLKILKSEAARCKHVEITKPCGYCKGKKVIPLSFGSKETRECFSCRGTGKQREYSTSKWF